MHTFASWWTGPTTSASGGAYDERIGRGSETMREPTSLMYLPPGADHAEHHRFQGRHLVIELEPTRLQQFDRGVDRLREPHDLRHESAVHLAGELRAEVHTPDAASPLVIEGLVLELLAAVVHGCHGVRGIRAPSWLRDVRQMLEANFQINVTLADVSAAVSVHPVHVARVFRRHHLCSVGEFVRRLRVQHSCRRIVESGDSLAAIALEAGFSDQAHLSRLVRRHIGVSPSDLRSGSLH